jgi:hypothetical protein
MEATLDGHARGDHRAHNSHRLLGEPNRIAAREGAAHGFRLAVCITGQLSRLELDSKLRHLLRPLTAAGANLSVFLALEAGAPARFSNPKRTSQGPGCAFEPTIPSILKRLGPYLRGHRFGPRPPLERQLNASAFAVLFPRYRLAEDNRHERLLNHLAQFEHSRRCAGLVQQHERSSNEAFDALLKIRDNSLVVRDLINGSSLLAAARTLDGVQVKQCSGRSGQGRNAAVGLNDKVMLCSREHWKAALSAPYEVMRSALKRQRTVPWLDSEEVFGLALRQRRLPIVKASPTELPFVDGRCRHQVKHRADPTSSNPGDMDKRWCALPACKDCWPSVSTTGFGRYLPQWPMCGVAHEWCWWLDRTKLGKREAAEAEERGARRARRAAISASWSTSSEWQPTGGDASGRTQWDAGR